MASDLTVGLDMIAAATVPTKPSARLLWGVVASTASPVQVVLENDASATPRPVSGNASGPVAMGDRVLLARQRRRLTIVANPTAQALPRPRRMNKPDSQPIATATNVTVVGWASGTGDPGNVAGGIRYGGGLFTVPVAGVYALSGSMRWASNSTGERQLQVRHNGAQRETLVMAASSDSRARGSISVAIYCAAGDTLAVGVRQTSGADLSFGDSSANEVWLTIACLGRL